MEKLYLVETNLNTNNIYATSLKNARNFVERELYPNEVIHTVTLNKAYNSNAKIKNKMAKAKTSYSKKPSFSKRGRTKEGNVSTTQGWSKKGESKIIKTVGYKTSKYGGGKRKMIITTIKKIIKR
tara:strand:+ start:387 stop:761 length:375 start_codon:yes stop_codon:yes gene_type:complete